MAIDYAIADHVLELSFGKLGAKNASLAFQKPAALSLSINEAFATGAVTPTLAHSQIKSLASAGIDMWHRAIHSLMWSVALTECSPLWASVSGYYSSHFVMRAFAHSMGIFKSFSQRKLIQIHAIGGHFVCVPFKYGSNEGEHAFYWKAMKGHPSLIANDLFRENHERDASSDAAHRTFANYTDHLCAYPPLTFASSETIASEIEKISRIRLHSVTSPSREDFPDLQNVQILAFQRIVAFHDFLDTRVSANRFWRTHRRPGWCKDVMRFQIEDAGLEALRLGPD